jgi:hypothetical protein
MVADFETVNLATFNLNFLKVHRSNFIPVLDFIDVHHSRYLYHWNCIGEKCIFLQCGDRGKVSKVHCDCLVI